MRADRDVRGATLPPEHPGAGGAAWVLKDARDVGWMGVKSAENQEAERAVRERG